jgi:protein-tyrosine phosphatase
MQNNHSLIFVCTANRFRSPIAAALFIKLLKEKGIEKNWLVGSAGSWTKDGLPVIPSPQWIIDHLGLDLSVHHSRVITRELIDQYDLILVMEKGQKEALQIEYPEISKRIFLLTELSRGPVYDIPDPICEKEETFLDVANEMNQLLENNFQEICIQAIIMSINSGDLIK